MNTNQHRYRLSVKGSAYEKITGFESRDDLYAIAEAHNLLKSGEYVFLENASLSKYTEESHTEPVATYQWMKGQWSLTWRNL